MIEPEATRCVGDFRTCACQLYSGPTRPVLKKNYVGNTKTGFAARSIMRVQFSDTQ